MRSLSLRHVLRSTAAVGAIALGSSTANAACTTAGGVVTCTGVSTSDEINAAYNRVAPPSVSLVIAQDANVVRGNIFSIAPSTFAFNGAIGYANSGIVGTPGANVDYSYFGTSAAPANSFTLDNRGTHNGSIAAFSIGGTVTGVNSGTVTRGINLSGAGPITFTNTGTVFNNSFSGATAVNLSSSRIASQTGADGVTRNTETGGLITALIGGTIGVPVIGTVAAQPQGVNARSAGDVDVTVTGSAGFVQAEARGNNRATQFTSARGTTTTTQTQVNDDRTVGGNSRVTIAATGRVTNVNVLSGPGTATAIVEGAVVAGPNGVGPGAVSASAFGTDSASRQTEVISNSGPFTSDRTSNSTSTANGGAALVDVMATGSAVGNVSAASNAGSATVRVAGQVGIANTFSSATATSAGTNSTFQNRSVFRADGTSEQSNSSTVALSGGTALTTIAATGQIFGNAVARGDVSATVDNAGRIRGIEAGSNSTLTTASTNSSSRTIAIDAAGVRTEVNRNDSTSTFQSLGGVAAATNRASGIVNGFVQVAGFGSAMLDNAGLIGGGVLLASVGDRTDTTNSDRTTSTSTPATGGGATTTFTRDTSRTSVTRATGGAVTGTYSGTVGSAPPASSFASVDQVGSTVSTATVTGTLFANFSGVAGAQNSDSASSSTSRQTTQPSGASTRAETSTSRTTATQIASSSSLTVAPTGRILASASRGGNASVISQGGNATITLDGGRVDGSVSVDAGAGSNVIETSDFASTSTRAASAPGTFVPELLQSQTSNASFEQRSAAGTGIARVNGGTIGGDLFVSGTGTGAGSLGADVLMNGALGGDLIAIATSDDTLDTTSEVSTRTGPNSLSYTVTERSADLPSTTRGGVLVNVGGAVGGGIVASADIGPSTLNLTGRAGMIDPSEVFVSSVSFLEQFERVEAFTETGFNFQLTSSRTTSSDIAMGGAATLNVAADAATRAANASSVEGDLFVQGFAGSTLDVSAGSRLLQAGGELIIGATYFNSSGVTTDTFANGVLTGSTETFVETAVGGLTIVNNAGIIGSTANRVNLQAGSVGGANIVNTGTVNGDITGTSRNNNVSSTTTVTNFNDLARFRVVTTETRTAVGGALRIDNAGLVTGNVSAVAANGAVTSSGVVRGAVTLGGGLNNFTTTETTTTRTSPNAPVEFITVVSPSVANATRFTQTYTLNQNGLLIGGVNVTGTTTVDPSGAAVRTSNVNAQINLNNGSITLGDVTGGPNTVTDVNLNGSGFLGVAANDATRPPVPGQVVTGFQPTPSLARFAAIDPTLGTTTPLPSGSRVSGVRTLTKAGDGAFVIVGAPFVPGRGTGTNAVAPTYTLDVGTLRINGGELQLGLAAAAPVRPTPGAGVGQRAQGGVQGAFADIDLAIFTDPNTAPAGSIFGIRGNVENNATLVLGRRVTDGARTAIQGIDLFVVGNVVNAAAGNLVVGVNPSFVAANAPAPGGSPFASTTTFAAFGPGSPGLASTNSFVRVDGNLDLAGAVTVQGQQNGIYEAGRAYDLFSVGGAYANTGTVRSDFTSPFVGFTLTPRSEGGRTIVSLNVVRTDFDTVATDSNAAAAARALQANLALAFQGVRAGNNADAQDLANIISALDTRLNAAQAQQLFAELSSGEFYGSLSALSTTAPFGEATDGLPLAEGAPAVGLWFRPTGQFAKYKANDDAGASEFDANNYGGSFGVNFNTGGGGHIGLAGGYGKIDASSATTEQAEADTWMVGFYGVQQLGRMHVSGQAVYGKTEWDVVRDLPLLGRVAESSFDSNEVRANLRVAYMVAPLPGLDISPFAKVEARRYEFDAFTETGAGAVSLTVGKRAKTIVSPEVGVRMAGVLGSRLRPFAEGSYIFQGDVGSDRTMAFVGGRATDFTAIGVDPQDSIKGAIGVAADVAGGTVFIRGDYASGGQQQVGSVRGGLLFSF